MIPSQPSDFVQRSEAKLYRGGRTAALDTFWLCEFLYFLRFV
jgi:hypothetical protein